MLWGGGGGGGGGGGLLKCLELKSCNMLEGASIDACIAHARSIV